MVRMKKNIENRKKEKEKEGNEGGKKTRKKP